VFRRVVLCVVVAALIVAGGSVAALANDRLLFIEGLAGIQLITVGVAVATVGLGVFAISKAVASSRTHEDGGTRAVVATVVLVVVTWLVVGFPLGIMMLFSTLTTYTRLSDVSGHENLVVASSHWDGVNLSLYQVDGLFLDDVSTVMPNPTDNFNPITAGEYTLVEWDGALVLTYPRSTGSVDHPARVVVP
jgi:multisubunit Na+/H+ antiporter MnhC subunit